MVRCMIGFSDVEIRDERKGNDLSPNTLGKLGGEESIGKSNVDEITG